MRLFIVFGSLFVLACVAHGVAINGTSNVIAKNSGSGVIGPPAINSQRRVSKDLFKNVKPSSTNSTSSKSPDQLQRRSSTGQVQILESGSALRNRGESRILKRGPPVRSRVTNFNMRTAPVRGGSLRSSSAYAIGVNAGPSSVSSSASYNDNVGAIPLIPIPGNNIPPPVYMYGNEAPSPPGSSSGSNYGGSPGPGPAIVTYRPTGGSGGGGGFISSTFSPIIFPPEVGTSEPDFGPGPQPIGPNPVTSVPIIGGGGGNGGGNGGGGSGPTLEPFPGPQPIGPNPGTSVPIIGGGGGGGESVLPPSPPPDEIFPPAPPPDDDEEEEEDEVVEEEEFDVGRRLKVDSGSGGGTRTGARTRTRIIPSSRPTSTRVSSKEIFNSSKDRLRGGVMRRERLRDKVKEFKTVLEDEEEVQEEIIVDDPNVITDFVFSEIKCFKTRQEEYFGATIHMKNGFHLPYIRDRPQDPLSSEECKLEQMEGTRGSYHMSVTDLRGCGVEQCGDALCLTMVFPRVPMLALADDEVTTIKCIPQSSTVSDTKSISFAGDSTDNRRSSSTVEGGVQEFVAEVGVFRQNAGSANGLFVKRVNSGGVVQLGEPLQLRSVVRGTDGNFKYLQKLSS
ncbi:unnamed protein product [Orchesella dallaii]|uniref:Uncharacterized protein n=1 Tax=Orchesella dallaii TaxID=48710 RepID=A0ABP1RA02_9HEXA